MDMQKWLGAGVLVVVLVVVVLYAALRPAPAKAPVASVPPPTLTGVAYAEHAPYYDIEAHFASSTPLREPANAAALTVMKDYIAAAITDFKSYNGDTLAADDPRTLDASSPRKASLKIVYIMGSSAHTVSYIYTLYADTLGAHENMYFKTFTFDTTTGKLLSLADLFTPGSKYLDTLSKLAREKLPAVVGENSDAATIAGGTEPTEDNFKNFLFDNRDLVILFPPYQVAAYAAGPQTLRLPVSLLTSLLKSEHR